MDSESLHREIIQRHAGRPRNTEPLPAPDVEVQASNPACGDEITLQLELRGRAISAARFQGEGCAISRASASMMVQRVEGLTLEEAAAMRSRFVELVKGSAEAARDPVLGDLRALAGVSRYPVRVKCALLAWDALLAAGEEARGRE